MLRITSRATQFENQYSGTRTPVVLVLPLYTGSRPRTALKGPRSPATKASGEWDGNDWLQLNCKEEVGCVPLCAPKMEHSSQNTSKMIVRLHDLHEEEFYIHSRNSK